MTALLEYSTTRGLFYYRVSILRAMCNAFEFFFQFECFTDCSTREYRSILDEISSVYSKIFTYYASIMLWPIMLFIVPAYLTKAEPISSIIKV